MELEKSLGPGVSQCKRHDKGMAGWAEQNRNNFAL